MEVSEIEPSTPHQSEALSVEPTVVQSNPKRKIHSTKENTSPIVPVTGPEESEAPENKRQKPTQPKQRVAAVANENSIGVAMQEPKKRKATKAAAKKGGYVFKSERPTIKRCPDCRQEIDNILCYMVGLG